MVAGKTLISTTTIGTRALRACSGAREIWVGSFLNLEATIDQLRLVKPERLVLVCSGTFEEAAMEDTLAAGAMANALWDLFEDIEDSAQIARSLHQSYSDNLNESIKLALNARRLLEVPELAEDVSFCSQQSIHDFVVLQDDHGLVRIL
jgi:2-phosphosulfolactate phosphatase